MTEEDPLALRYADHPPVRKLIDVVAYCAESVSLDFDRWEDSYVQGPGLYVVVVAGTSIAEYADPMGGNRWPTDACDAVTDDLDAFFDAARTVAVERDGAVVVTVDGVVHEQMVRLKDLSTADIDALADDERPEYADWMGARHMSAVDTSLREGVVAAVTLSEEDGRVTRFQDGDYTDHEREALGGEWRVVE
ncbi:MAG: hypothetical protein ABEJ61_00745 [Haloferacaceae archaeon]